MGQAQAGTDISGTPASYPGQFWGVQCKGKDAVLRAKVTQRELKSEVDKAKAFNPKLSRWILASTGPKDAKIEELARQITVRHQGQGLFSVHVMAWEDLQSLIAGHPDVIDEFYEGQGPLGSELRKRIVNIDDALGAQEATMQLLLAEVRNISGHVGGRMPVSSVLSADAASVNPSDIAIQAQIDIARDFIASYQPASALRILPGAEQKFWQESSGVARFRLLANRASAFVNLGRLDEGLACAKQALSHAPDDPRAIVHAAMVHYQARETDTARLMLDALLKSAPSNNDAIALRTLIAADESDRENPFWLVPFPETAPWNVRLAIAKWFRHRGQPELALVSYRLAHEANPTNHEVAAELAVTLLEILFRDEGVVYGHRMTAGQTGEFDWAVATLQKIWDDVRESEAKGAFLVVAANLCTAYRYRDDLAHAGAIVDQGLSVDPNDRQMLRDKALLLVREGGRDRELLELLDKLPAEEPEAIILRANSLATLGRTSEALEALDKMPRDASERMRITAVTSRVRLLAAEGQGNQALEQATRLTETHPSNPLAFLALSDVHHRLNDNERAREAARAALDAVDPDPAVGSFIRVIVADALHALRDWDACADALAPLAGTAEDSHPLQLRVNALLQAGRRQELETLLASLPDHVAKLPAYARAAAWFYRGAGDYGRARAHLESYVAVVPNDLFMRLLWLDCIEREDDKAAIDAFLNEDVEQFFTEQAGTRELMTLAQALARHGFGNRSVDLGYRVLRKRWLKPRAHLGYMGLILMIEPSRRAIPALTAVGPDAAFVVRDDNGRLLTYVVETEPSPDAAALEIAPASALACRALGLSVGGTIQVHGSPLKPVQTIVEIKHKYVALFHRSLQNFNQMFPGESGMISFDVDTDSPGRFIEQIRPFLTGQADQAQRVASAYEAGLPICFILRDPIDAWSILVGKGIQIQVDTGSQEERDEALARLRSGAGVVLDPLACWVAGKLGLLDALRKRFGQIGIASTTLDVIRSHRDRLSDDLGRSEGMLLEEEGAVRFRPRSEAGPGSMPGGGEICGWFEANAVILSAIPSTDFPPAMRELGENAHPSIIDTVFAASGSGYVMIAEDMRLRMLVQSLPGVRTAWLQVAVLAALEAGHIDRKTYGVACANWVVLKHHFTSFDDAALMQAAEREGWSPIGVFDAMSQTLASPTIEANSTSLVVASFLFQLWRRPQSRRTKERLADSVLANCKMSNASRVSEIRLRLESVRKPGRMSLAREDAGRLRQLLSFIDSWTAQATGRRQLR